MLEVTARDGRARMATWKPAQGGQATTPALVFPDTSLATAPTWAQVTLGRSGPGPVPGAVRLLSGGTWFTPVVQPAGSDGKGPIVVPTVRTAPTAEPQTLLAGDELAILHDAGAWAGDAKRFLHALPAAARVATPGRLLWAPAMGTPQDYALYAYLGIDLFDVTPLLLAAAKGQVLTAEGSFTSKEAASLGPADAAAFGATGPDGLPAGVLDESLRHAHRELALVRHHIANGTLRSLVERRVYGRPGMVETLRRFDREHTYLEAMSPRLRSTPLPCMSVESLWMPEVESFRRRVRDHYQPPPADVLVLFPCSARKPYKLSRSHRHYLRTLEASGMRHRIHEVMVTSPLGLVPRDLEELYPANAYDIPVTGHWMLDEQEIVREQLASLLEKGNYRHVVAHVGAATLDAFDDLLPDGFRHTVLHHPTAPDDLARLAAELQRIKGEFSSNPSPALASPVDADADVSGEPSSNDPDSSPAASGALASLPMSGPPVTRLPATAMVRPGRGDRRLSDLEAVASFQFGAAVAADLVAGAHSVGRPPFLKLEGPEGQRAMTTPEKGQLSLTLDGARIVARHGVRRVFLKEFDLKRTSTLFAVGVEGADPDIRPGDEVVLMRGEEVKGCGTAVMSASEMVHLNRGVACTVRHLAAAKTPTPAREVLA
ncbi:MAG TPA: DUF5591 domain-containing protein [Candidatus Thermoplasmatota archaeon]|nr:DUF5591 domain-containing protein [Candidatus Thermoplasmatota archaeon]